MSQTHFPLSVSHRHLLSYCKHRDEVPAVYKHHTCRLTVFMSPNHLLRVGHAFGFTKEYSRLPWCVSKEIKVFYSIMPSFYKGHLHIPLGHTKTVPPTITTRRQKVALFKRYPTSPLRERPPCLSAWQEALPILGRGPWARLPRAVCIQTLTHPEPVLIPGRWFP